MENSLIRNLAKVLTNELSRASSLFNSLEALAILGCVQHMQDMPNMPPGFGTALWAALRPQLETEEEWKMDAWDEAAFVAIEDGLRAAKCPSYLIDDIWQAVHEGSMRDAAVAVSRAWSVTITQ